MLARLAAEGPAPLPVLAEEACELFSFGWSGPRGQVTARDTAAALGGVRWAVTGLDLIELSDGFGAKEIWAAGPAATSLLPRATLIADHAAAS